MIKQFYHLISIQISNSIQKGGTNSVNWDEPDKVGGEQHTTGSRYLEDIMAKKYSLKRQVENSFQLKNKAYIDEKDALESCQYVAIAHQTNQTT